jgi:hypothetical protein
MEIRSFIALFDTALNLRDLGLYRLGFSSFRSQSEARIAVCQRAGPPANAYRGVTGVTSYLFLIPSVLVVSRMFVAVRSDQPDGESRDDTCRGDRAVLPGFVRQSPGGKEDV